MSVWLQFIVERLIVGLGFTFPFWIGLGIAFAFKKIKQHQKLPRTPIVLGAAVVGLAFVGNLLPSDNNQASVAQSVVQRSEEDGSSEARLVADNSRVQTVVSREPSGGAVDADLDQRVLKEIEQRTLVSFRKGMIQELTRRGKTLSSERLSADSVYVEKSGRKLAVTKLRADGLTLGVQIAGLVNDEFVRLMCVTNEPKEIEIVTGPCAAATKETFGISFVEAVDG